MFDIEHRMAASGPFDVRYRTSNGGIISIGNCFARASFLAAFARLACDMRVGHITLRLRTRNVTVRRVIKEAVPVARRRAHAQVLLASCMQSAVQCTGRRRVLDGRRIVANRPGMAGTVPEVWALSRQCPGRGKIAIMSRNL